MIEHLFAPVKRTARAGPNRAIRPIAAAPAPPDDGRVDHLRRARLLLPFALGLVLTGLSVAHASLWLRAAVEVAGLYVVGRVLRDVPLGRILAALAGPGVLATLVDPARPWWWPFVLLPAGLVVDAVPVSVGQLHAARATGSRAGLDEARARAGALVTLVSVSLLGILAFFTFGRSQLDHRNHSVEGRLDVVLHSLDGRTDDRSEVAGWITLGTDVHLVRSSWDGEWLRLWFEVRTGILPTGCVTGITGEGGWDTGSYLGPCR
jgi:hypothetical protein